MAAGIYLMKSLMDEVHFERGGNRSAHAKGSAPGEKIVNHVFQSSLVHCCFELLKLTSTASTVVMDRRVSFLNLPCVSTAYAKLDFL